MTQHPITAVADYCRRGWPVFPCKPDKQPKTRNGFKDAHTDFEVHRAWWVDHPDDLIGIATGVEMGSNLLVLDLDSYKAGGHPEWNELAATNGGLPPTYTVRTGQGGLQHYYLCTEPVRSSTDTVRGDNVRNVDVRGVGGYVIAAPSETVFGPYELIDDRNPVPAPGWLIEFAQRAKAVGIRTPAAELDPAVLEALTPEDRSRLEDYVSRAVDGEVTRLAECAALATPDPRNYRGPAWDQTVFEVACNLIELANSAWTVFTEDDAHAVLLSNAPRDAGFSQTSILAKWDSARKKVGNTGRPLPTMPTGGGYFIPFEGGGGVIDPAQFFTKGEGLNVTLLVQAVLDMGPLAIEDTEGRAVWSYRHGVWKHAPNEIADRCSVLLGSRFRVNHVATVLPPLRQRMAAGGHLITCEPVEPYINVQNGMLDWRTGQLVPHAPEFYSTVQLPVEWEPDAVCSQFDTFAAEVMAADAIEYLWEIIGYLVYSGNPLQRAVLLHGAGANGKGTLLRVLTSLLGAHNTSSVTLADITEGKFDIASLFGKIANLAGDIDAAYMKSTAKFKAITGEDKIKAERKYEHGFEFECWAVPVFSANEFWKSADTTTGYKRRWQLLPFPNTFEVVSDRGLTARLITERAGILVRAVAALRTLMERGDFATPQSARSEKERFELAADQIAEWLLDDPAVTVAKPAEIGVRSTRAEAYRQYRRWTEESGNGPMPKSKWWQRLDSLGYSLVMNRGYESIQGLGLDLRHNVSGWPQVGVDD